MERRDFLKNSGLVVAGLASHNLFAGAKNQTPQSKADFNLRIAPVSFDIAPGKTIHTVGYNGQVPGPLLRMKEGVIQCIGGEESNTGSLSAGKLVARKKSPSVFRR